MFKDRLVKIAFATGDRKEVNASFEQARQIVVYEVTTTRVRACDAITYRGADPHASSLPGTSGRNGKGGGGGGGGCCGGKKKQESINEEEIDNKVASLAGVSVLFVNKTLNAYSVLVLNNARIFTVKVDGHRNIPEVVARLQEMLRGDPPLWLRRALIGSDTVIEEEPGILQGQKSHC